MLVILKVTFQSKKKHFKSWDLILFAKYRPVWQNRIFAKLFCYVQV